MKPFAMTILLGLLTAAAPHALSGGDAVTSVEHIQIDGICNFSQIHEMNSFAGPRIGFGGATQAVAMAQLKSEGFATVVNLRLAEEQNADLESSADAARAAGINYVHIPFDTSAPAAAVVEEFLAVVGDDTNQPTYLHCGSATRAAALWMIARALVDDWDVDRASAEAMQIAGKPAAAVAFATAYIESRSE